MTEGVTNTIGVCQVTQVVSPNSFRLNKLKACSRLWRAEGWIGGGDGSDPEIEPRSARRRGADNRHSPPHGGSLPSKLSLPEGRRAGKEAGTTDSEGGTAEMQQITTRPRATTGTPERCSRPAISDSQYAQVTSPLDGPGRRNSRVDQSEDLSVKVLDSPMDSFSKRGI